MNLIDLASHRLLLRQLEATAELDAFAKRHGIAIDVARDILAEVLCEWAPERRADMATTITRWKQTGQRKRKRGTP